MAKEMDNHNSLLDRYNAMEGELLRMKELMDKFSEQVHQPNVFGRLESLLKLLRESKRLLGVAHRLSLTRRNRRLINTFRILSVSKNRENTLENKIAALQTMIKKVLRTFVKVSHLLSDVERSGLDDKVGDKIVKFQAHLKSIYGRKKVEQIGLLFTYAKDVVDFTKAIPTLDSCYEDFLMGVGDFSDSNRHNMAGVWYNWRKENPDFKLRFEGKVFQKSLNNFEFSSVVFVNCVFTKGVETLKIAIGVNNHFESCKFQQIHMDSSVRDSKIVVGKGDHNTKFVDCSFYKCRGDIMLHGSEFSGTNTFQAGKNLRISLTRSTATKLVFQSGRYRLGFEKTNIGELSVNTSKLSDFSIIGDVKSGKPSEVDLLTINSTTIENKFYVVEAKIKQFEFMGLKCAYTWEGAEFYNGLITRCTFAPSDSGIFKIGSGNHLPMAIDVTFENVEIIESSFKKALFYRCAFTGKKAQIRDCKDKVGINAEFLHCSFDGTAINNCIFSPVYEFNKYLLELKGDSGNRWSNLYVQGHSVEEGLISDLAQMYGRNSDDLLRIHREGARYGERETVNRQLASLKKHKKITGEANFVHCEFKDVDMKDCSGINYLFAGRVEFDGVNMENVVVEDLSDAVSLRECFITRSTFRKINFLGNLLNNDTPHHLKITECKFFDLTIDISPTNWVVFEYCRFESVDFSESRVSVVKFRQSRFISCDYDNVYDLDQTEGVPQTAVKRWTQLHRKTA